MLDFRIDPETGEPTIPLDKKWKLKEWQIYLHNQAACIVAQAIYERDEEEKKLPRRPRRPRPISRKHPVWEAWERKQRKK